jgi:hypothetical protein
LWKTKKYPWRKGLCRWQSTKQGTHTQHNIFIATRRRHVSTTAPFSKLKTPPTTAFTHDGESSSFSSHYFSQPNHTFLSSNPFQRISTFLKPPSLLNRRHITTHQQRPNFYSFFHHPIAFHNLGRTHFLWYLFVFEVWILWLRRKMEEIEGVNCSSESRPPHPNPSIASAFRQCQRNDPVVLPCRKSLVRHASLVRIFCFIVIILIIMLLVHLFGFFFCCFCTVIYYSIYYFS